MNESFVTVANIQIDGGGSHALSQRHVGGKKQFFKGTVAVDPADFVRKLVQSGASGVISVKSDDSQDILSQFGDSVQPMPQPEAGKAFIKVARFGTAGKA